MALKQAFYRYPIGHFDENAMEELLLIYRLMKRKISETSNLFRQGALQGYAQALTANAYHQFLTAVKGSNAAQEKIDRNFALYKQFIMEVRKHYKDHRDIEFYANLVCVTPKYLSRVVHQVSGRFTKDWIDDYVMLEAKALLKSRRHTVQEIAFQLHFPSQSAFGKFFRRKLGISPLEYALQEQDDEYEHE